MLVLIYFKNPSKFTRTSITTKNGFERMAKNANFKSGHRLSSNFYEITKKPSGFTEKYPIHCGTAVLHMSKLILLRFMNFLHKHLIPDSFEIVYSGKLYLFISRIKDFLRYRLGMPLFGG